MLDRVADHTHPQPVNLRHRLLTREGVAAGGGRIGFAIDKVDILLLLV
jgi:hypothetical protein